MISGKISIISFKNVEQVRTTDDFMLCNNINARVENSIFPNIIDRFGGECKITMGRN